MELTESLLAIEELAHDERRPAFRKNLGAGLIAAAQVQKIGPG